MDIMIIPPQEYVHESSQGTFNFGTSRMFLVTNVMNVNNFLLHHKNQGTDFLTFCTSKIIKNQMEKMLR